MKQIILPLLTALALVGCSKSEFSEVGGGGAPTGEIEVTAVVDGTRTRTISDAGTGLAGASFVVKHDNAAPSTWSDGTFYTGNVAPTTGKVTFTSTTPPTYSGDRNAWFVAYHPGKALTNNAVEWNIDGTTDIMVTNTMWSAGNSSNPVNSGLHFNHRLARIEVVVKAESARSLDVVRKSWGKVQKIEFVAAPTKMKYDLATTPGISTSAPANFRLLANYAGDSFAEMDIPDRNNATPNAVAMLAPVTATPTESFRLKVTTAGDGVTPIELEVPVSLNNNMSPMMAGCIHTVVLTFEAGDNQQITVTTSTVDNWTDNNEDSDEGVSMPIRPTILNYGRTPYGITSGKFGYSSNYSISTATTVSYNNMGYGMPSYSGVVSALASEFPYASFEVATADESFSPVMGGANADYWLGAWNICKAKDPANQWRLPRVSELMLMALNRAALENTPGFTAFETGGYWSATEITSNDRVLYVQFYSDPPIDVAGAYKFTGYKARCVREMPLLPRLEYGKAPFSITEGRFFGVTYQIPAATTTSYNDVAQPGTLYTSVAAVLAGEPPYANFEVAPMDEMNSQVQSSYTWQEAWDICKNKRAGGGWRLPRLSELMLMYLNKTALAGTAGFTAFVSGFYWSATDASSTNCWTVDGGDGEPRSISKTSPYYRVRCVREVK